MRVLVTGGAGFIGCNFVRYVVRNRKWNITVYDKLTYAGRLENISDILDKIKFVKGDIREEAALESVVRDFKPDLVINFAAETHVDRSINSPSSFIETNILGMYVLLEVARRHDISRILHISTDEVYGDLWGTNDRADEESQLMPSNPYSASKASGDLLLMSYGKTYGLRYKIARPCNNYGPYQHPEKLIPRTVIRLLLGKPAVIYGDGSQLRDWMYVEDTIRALITILDHGSTGETYNICAGNYISVKEIVEDIVRIMKKDPSRSIIYAKGRPSEDRRYAMICDKIKSLGWQPTVTTNEGLKRTIEWYTRNEEWWKPILDEKYVLADTPW